VNDVAHIAAGHRVVGTVSAAEDLVILGRVEGRIQSEGMVTVEAGAIVEAEILARHVLIRGVVVGDVSGVEGIEVAAQAQVLGDLRTRRLALRAGGRVAGAVTTGIEVQPFIYAGKSAAQSAWRSRTTTVPMGGSRSAWPLDEVVESVPARSGAGGGGSEARKTSNEPSREIL
jgi:cytoskeletal protein CcmA (bactofilin family)